MINNRSGFTFLELLITLTIMAICFLPLMNMFSTALSQTSHAAELSTARYLAQEGMEKLKNLNFTVAQLKKLGKSWDPPLGKPPLVVDKMKWRVLREIDGSKEMLQAWIKVYREEDIRKNPDQAKAHVQLVTLFEDFEW